MMNIQKIQDKLINIQENATQEDIANWAEMMDLHEYENLLIDAVIFMKDGDFGITTRFYTKDGIRVGGFSESDTDRIHKNMKKAVTAMSKKYFADKTINDPWDVKGGAEALLLYMRFYNTDNVWGQTIGGIGWQYDGGHFSGLEELMDGTMQAVSDTDDIYTLKIYRQVIDVTLEQFLSMS